MIHWWSGAFQLILEGAHHADQINGVQLSLESARAVRRGLPLGEAQRLAEVRAPAGGGRSEQPKAAPTPVVELSEPVPGCVEALDAERRRESYRADSEAAHTPRQVKDPETWRCPPLSRARRCEKIIRTTR